MISCLTLTRAHHKGGRGFLFFVGFIFSFLSVSSAQGAIAVHIRPVVLTTTGGGKTIEQLDLGQNV